MKNSNGIAIGIIAGVVIIGVAAAIDYYYTNLILKKKVAVVPVVATGIPVVPPVMVGTPATRAAGNYQGLSYPPAGPRPMYYGARYIQTGETPDRNRF